MLVSGHDPLNAYAEIVKGSLSPAALPDTLNWATPLVGMTLAAAIPLRGGMVNLGGDGQLVIGGLIGALAPLFLPVPGASAPAVGLALAALGGGLYAALAAWGEVRHGVPMLISSLLLSYPAVGVTSYLARFPLRDVSTGLPQTLMVPPDARLYALSGALNVGSLLIAAIALAVVFVDRRTSARLRIAHAGQEPAICRLRRRAARTAGRWAHVRERRDRRPRRRDRRARLAIPVHRRSAAHTGLHLVRADGGVARQRRARRGDRRRPVLRRAADRWLRHAAGDVGAPRADARDAGDRDPLPGHASGTGRRR